MANMLAAGEAFRVRKMKAHAGISLTYSRGSDSVTLTGWLGRTQGYVTDLDGNAQGRWTDADFLIEAAELILDGERVIPKDGDLIELETGGRALTMRVGSQPGTDAWTWANEFQTLFRVHAKQVAAEEV